jgi:hypothetical protein
MKQPSAPDGVTTAGRTRLRSPASEEEDPGAALGSIRNVERRCGGENSPSVLVLHRVRSVEKHFTRRSPHHADMMVAIQNAGRSITMRLRGQAARPRVGATGRSPGSAHGYACHGTGGGTRTPPRAHFI